MNLFKKTVALIIFILLFNLLIGYNANLVYAQNTNESGTYLENPLGSESLTAIDIYARLIYAFMGFTGILALIMFILGGFQWMTAGGNAEKIKKGRDTLIWAVLGLVIIFASYAILRAVFQTLQFGAG
ncbi:pilin [Patescibacteria group bacterium]|nr:pilin [Patescibacteria group bacterium]